MSATAPLRIYLHGATGRMGQAIEAELQQAPEHYAWVSPQPLDALDPASLDVLIDFTGPAGLDQALAWCRQHGKPLVSGSTGLDAGQFESLDAAAADIPLLWAANMSLGANVLMHLAASATQLLGNADVEIHEAHHRHKQDAPSGTALALGEVVAAARGQKLQDVARYDRSPGSAPRSAGEIGFSVTRAGELPGSHQLLFALPGETLTLGHEAASRQAFARGSLQAARWLADRPAGRYRMAQVLGLEA